MHGSSNASFLLSLLELISTNPEPEVLSQYLAINWPDNDNIRQVAIMEVEQDATVQVIGWFGLELAAIESLQLFSMWDDLPMALAIREQRMVTLRNQTELFAEFPNLADAQIHVSGIVTAPILASSSTVGVFALMTHEPLHDAASIEQHLQEVCVALGLYLLIRHRVTCTSTDRVHVRPSNGHAEHLSQAHLTERQQTVLNYLAEGYTNGQIAQRMDFSESTIRQETMAIYRYLSVGGRREAVSAASIRGLLGERRVS
jgi:DNA-binding CsgD family transcriptional regulator